jgi:hypothetical protein
VAAAAAVVETAAVAVAAEIAAADTPRMITATRLGNRASLAGNFPFKF